MAGTHIHIMSAEADVYPALPMTTALITDYSSIYMDYLWLDRPMLFLVPDLQEYVSRDREIQFDFAEMTPGPKLSTWPEVMNALSRLDASHADARARLRRLAFDNFDQARSSRKIAQHMLRHRWIEPAPAP